MLKSLDYVLRAAVFAGAAGFALAFAITTRGDTLPLVPSEIGSGEGSVALLLLLLALVIGFVVTGVSYRRNHDTDVTVSAGGTVTIPRRASWLARLVTATASGLMLFAATAAVLYVFSIIAPVVVLERVVVLVVVTVYAAATALALAYWSSNVDAVNLLILAGLTGLTGIIIAALVVGNPTWWQRSLSYLGSTETAGNFFNVAIIVMGLLILAINEETIAVLRALVDAERLSEDYFLAARFYLIAIPIGIMGVGLFPTRITPLSDFLHNLSSHLMLVFFLIMMWFTVNRKDSFHSQSFRQWSRVFAVFILVIFVLMYVDIINFVSFQLIIFVPMGIWLLLYLLQVRDFAFTGEPAEVKAPRPQTPLALFAVRAGLIALGVGALLAIVGTAQVEKIDLINPAADATLARMLLMLGFVLGVTVTAFGYRRFVLEDPALSATERAALEGRGFWVGRAIISATAGLVMFFVTAIGIVVMDQLAPGVAFAPSNAIVIVAAYSGVVGFALAYWAGNLDNINLLILAGITMLLGIVLGSLFIGNPEWWSVSLSYLGSTANPAMGFFNYGILITGLILLIINLDTIGLMHVMQDEGRISADYLMMVRWLLIIIPVGLIGVAVFPRRINDLFDILHNLAATLMVVFYVVLAFLVIARYDTIFDSRFVRVSRILSGIIPVLYLFYLLNIIAFVAMQLLLAIPIGLWLLLFQQETRAYARSGPPPQLDEARAGT